MDAAAVREAFRSFVGEERFRKFVRVLNSGRHDRLLYWQEQLWLRFAAEHPEMALSDTSVRELFRSWTVPDREPEDWPFADPPNLICATVRQVIHGCQPVLRVAHDEGVWTFLTGAGEIGGSDGMLIDLRSMVDRDPSVAELADLPVDWQACRERPGAPWRRCPMAAADA